MKKKTKKMKKVMKDAIQNEKGLAIGMIIVAIALLAIVAGAVALQSRSASTSVARETSKTHASTILQEGVALRTGYDLMVARGTDPATITFDSIATTGLFHPQDGGAVKQTPPADAMASAQPWTYKMGVQVMGVGIDANEDYMAVLPDIKLGTCQNINNTLYALGAAATPPTGAGALADWTTAATAVDMSAMAAVNEKPELCIRTTDGRYVFYKAMIER